GERKSLALKAKKESSDEECSTSRSKDEEYAMAVKDFKKFFKRREFPKPLKDKNQRAFVGGSWSDSSEVDDEKVKYETCQICDNKCRVTFFEHDSEITKDGKVIGRGIKKKGLYVMKLGNKSKDKICLATIDKNFTLWHRRLGHANMRLIQSLASKELVRNLPKLKFDQNFYDACKIGKQAHASHKAKNIVSTTKCLELLHMDLFGPSIVRSYEGNRYTLVIVDDYSSSVMPMTHLEVNYALWVMNMWYGLAQGTKSGLEDKRRGKVKIALRDEHSAAWQEALPPGRGLDWIVARRKSLPPGRNSMSVTFLQL
ncbi:retrovirus-related pol polyprotein from transposon TNT 1-94, partial [Tanacetum coccineum]